jgi:hypothetical protein
MNVRIFASGNGYGIELLNKVVVVTNPNEIAVQVAQPAEVEVDGHGMTPSMRDLLLQHLRAAGLHVGLDR